jgi:integrase
MEGASMAKKKATGNGSGTVYPRRNKDGKITSYLSSYFTADGKRRYVSAKTKTECREKLRQAMSHADKGLVFDAGTLTLGGYLDKWLPSIKDTVRQRTWERYESIVRVHIKPALGAKKLKDLTRAHVKGLYRDRLDSGSSPRTVQYVHVTLHKALKDAVADNLIPRNVSDGLKPSKSRRHEINPLNQQQAKTFLQAARGDRYEALYVLAVHCGLRQGELLGLKWADVDLASRTLQVRRTMSEAREGRIEEDTKNGKGRRIELTKSVVEGLRTHRARQQQEIKDKDSWQVHGLIFPSLVGTPTNSKNLYWRSFKPLLKAAELPDIKFHELRHTCATIRFMKGQHPKQVQELLGHSSVAFTLDKYSHIIPGLGDDDVMEDALS